MARVRRSLLFIIASAVFFALKALDIDVPLVDEVWAGVACLVASKA